jgi:hypothetical protein
MKQFREMSLFDRSGSGQLPESWFWVYSGRFWFCLDGFRSAPGDSRTTAIDSGSVPVTPGASKTKLDDFASET